jgi:hypothetical protein
MPFSDDIFTHLFDWEKDPQRQEKIINSRLESEFDGLDAGLSSLAARVTATEDAIDNIAIAPAGHLYGLTLSNNAGDATNDIDISSGVATDRTNAVSMSLSSGLTKRLDANWAAGTSQGMRNSAAAITNATYHIYLVAKANGADPDIYAHTSTTVATVVTALQAESGGGSYIYARRIGSIMRAGGSIRGFSQDGDQFLLTTVVADQSAVVPAGTTGVLVTLSVPTGIKVRALMRARLIYTSTQASMFLGSPDESDQMMTSLLVGPNSLFSSGHFEIRTNTSAQIRRRVNDVGLVYDIWTFGWIDRCGRDS